MENEHILPEDESDSVSEVLSGQDSRLGEGVIQDDAFSYEGYQVVRREFFAHVYEPSITFNNCKVWLNSVCLNRLSDIDYMQILVNQEDKKLVVRPSSEDEKDSFIWCTANSSKRKPKQISCRIFFAKVVQLMEWNPDCRYKLLGKLIRSGEEYLFIFDLKATEIFQRILREGEKPKTSRTPVFPAEWQNQFGLPVKQHRRLLQVNIFDGYTVFGIKDKSAEASANASEEQPIRKDDEA